MSEGVQYFFCGLKQKHECDSDGPVLYGGDNVPTTDDITKAGKGYTWGSVTCSVCGLDAMTKSLWQDSLEL